MLEIFRRILYNRSIKTDTKATMDSYEPKKLAIIRILQILEKYSDDEHPITHEKIVELLDSEYGLIIERKAVGRNISLLIDVGYEIKTTKRGRIFRQGSLKTVN